MLQVCSCRAAQSCGAACICSLTPQFPTVNIPIEVFDAPRQSHYLPTARYFLNPSVNREY